MTHNKSVKTFDGISPYLELEDECLEATMMSHQTYLAENSKFVPNFKRKKSFHKGNKNYNIKPRHDEKIKYRGKHGNKNNMNKVKCFNYQKFGHFIKNCSESKRAHNIENVCTFHNIYYHFFI